MKYKDLFEGAARIAAAYREHDDNASPYPKASAEVLRRNLMIDLPKDGRSGEEIIKDLAEGAADGLVRNTGDAFFSWVMGGSHPVGVAADFLTSAWGQNAGIFQTTPASAIAEEAAGAWLLDLLDLPREASIGFVTGATMAGFTCLAAARQSLLAQRGWDLVEDGVFGAPEIPVYVSDESHSTIYAALRYLGFGARRLIQLPTDDQGRILTDALEAALKKGDRPGIIISQAGHINTGAFDDFQTINALARAHHAWHHVDGAFGLWARAAPSRARFCVDIDGANSWSVDGHKWLQVPYDSGYAIVRDADAHARAMTIQASYLNKSASDGKIPSDFTPELSRRARGFATWAVLQALGRNGVTDLIEKNCANARTIAQALSAVEGINILNDVHLNQIVISFGPMADKDASNTATKAVVERLQAQGEWFVKDAAWRGRAVLRLSLSGPSTPPSKIEAFAEDIIEAWRFVAE